MTYILIGHEKEVEDIILNAAIYFVKGNKHH